MESGKYHTPFNKIYTDTDQGNTNRHAVYADCVINEYGNLLPDPITNKLKDSQQFNGNHIYQIMFDMVAGQYIVFKQYQFLDTYSFDIENKTQSRPSNSIATSIYDGTSKIFAVCGSELHTLDLNTMTRTEKTVNIQIHRDKSSACNLPYSTRIMLIGGSATTENVDMVIKVGFQRGFENTSAVGRTYICNDLHTAIKECEIFDHIKNESVKISNMKYARSNCGCVYNDAYDQVIFGDGIHFKNMVLNGPQHYNHTFEIYDMNKNKWILLKQKLAYNYPDGGFYADAPYLWMDLAGVMGKCRKYNLK